MTQETGRTDLTSGLGFVGMLGGALFVAIYLGLTAMGGNNYATAYTFNVVSAVPILLFAFGTVGLYYRHRESFGWLGRVGTVVLLAGFSTSVLNSTWLLATGEHLLPVALQWGYILTEVLGALLLGAAIVRAGDLPHALAGGALFALGLPLSVGLFYLLFAVLELVESGVLGAFLFTLPFGAAWVILGYDLVTERDLVEPAAG